MVALNIGFNREDAVAVVDASPGGATVAILSTPKNAAAAIQASASSSLSLEPRTPEQAKAQIGAQVKEAADRASKMYASAGRSAPITSVYVIVHAPWSSTRLVSSRTRYEKETRMDDSHIGTLARQALDGSDIDKARLLEATVVRIAVNGYPTPDPAGVHASSAEVISLASDADPEVRSAIEAAVHASFPVAAISWRSAVRAMATLAAQTHLDGDFLTIDMGADDTHIASIQNGVLEQLVVPEGARTILARAAGGRSSEEALGYMRMIARDACSTEACEAVKQALAGAEPELVRIFGESMAKIATKRRVPNGLILSAHPDLLDWLSAFFARIDFAQFTVTSLPLSVYTPETLDIGQWVAGGHTYDPITIGAALVNIEART